MRPIRNAPLIKAWPVMPTIPCANLNVPVLMVAEKMADRIMRRA